EPVGTYEYGSCAPTPNGAPCPPADRYFLKIRVESRVDNPNQSPSVDAAQPGQTVRLFLQQGVGPEMPAGTLVLNDRGLVKQMDLVPGEVPTNPLFELIGSWYDGF